MNDEVVRRKLTRKEKVLALLRASAGEWIPGTAICHPEVGGSEGLRRVRELRADGHIIEHRRRQGRDSFEYRLLLGDPGPYGTQLKFDVRRR